MRDNAPNSVRAVRAARLFLPFALLWWPLAPASAASEALPLENVAQSCERIANRLASVDRRHCRRPALRAADIASVRGSAILYEDFPPPHDVLDGRRPVRVLLFGGIHGDELSSISIVFRFIDRLDAQTERRLHWRIIPALNPDGLLRARATRTNARGVDLNRNFPSPDWQRSALPYWRKATGKDPRRYPGPDALSEPESRLLAEQIMRFAPDVIVAMHAPLGLLDFDGVAHSPPTRLGFLELRRLGTYPGSLGNWAGEYLRIPVFTPELNYAGIMPTQAQTDALWNDLGNWISTRLAVPLTPAAARVSIQLPLPHDYVLRAPVDREDTGARRVPAFLVARPR